MAIKIIIDKSEATIKEIEELNNIINFGAEKYNFDKAGIEIIEITKRNKDILKDNKKDIETK